MLQMEHQVVHLRALAAWRELPWDTQKLWNKYARPVISHKPPFDNKAHISGQNLFVSAYHGFARLGNEHVPQPMHWEGFPPYALQGVSGVMVEEGVLLLDFKVWMDEYAEDDRYQILARIQLVKQGRGFNAGKMRTFLALVPCRAGESITGFGLVNYIDVWGLDLQEYTVHIRHVLLDRKSGFRSQYIQNSFDIILP
ncbi:MAG: hypothetical protein IK113_08220 [Bacteroidales bacterium]|nr:hypothetical protein [Bacteroidales bacterium]